MTAMVIFKGVDVWDIDVINVCNVYQKFLINAFVIFVNVYYFNKRQMKYRKSFVE